METHDVGVAARKLMKNALHFIRRNHGLKIVGGWLLQSRAVRLRVPKLGRSLPAHQFADAGAPRDDRQIGG